ncbi:MAG: CARDB domain-containing protein [Candidatus Gracilibacteria bacterium]
MNKYSLLVLGLVLVAGAAVFGIANAADIHARISDETPLADLRITSVIFDANTGNPIVTVKNVGRADAGAKRKQRAFKVMYSWLSEYSEQQKVESWVATVAKGASVKIKFPTASAARLRPLNRSNSLTVTLDSTNLIKEEFENNNIWEGDIEKPDFVVETVTYDTSSQKITVFVKNQGQVRAGRKYEVGIAKLAHWWLDEDGNEVGSKLSEKISSVAAGDSQKIEWTNGVRNYQGEPAGAVQLIIQADAEERVMEKSEINNIWVEELSDEEYTTPCNPETSECSTFDGEEGDNASTIPEDSEPAADTNNQPADQSGAQPSGQGAQQPDESGIPSNQQQSDQSDGTGSTPPATRWQSNSDLILLPGSVYFRPTPATAGLELKFWATVQNVGTGPTGQLTRPNSGRVGDGDSDAYLRIDLGNDGTWDVLKTTYTPAIYQDHIALKSFGLWPAVRGNHKYQICADGADEVWETDETNNCVTNTFSVQ